MQQKGDYEALQLARKTGPRLCKDDGALQASFPPRSLEHTIYTHTYKRIGIYEYGVSITRSMHVDALETEM